MAPGAALARLCHARAEPGGPPDAARRSRGLALSLRPGSPASRPGSPSAGCAAGVPAEPGPAGLPRAPGRSAGGQLEPAADVPVVLCKQANPKGMLLQMALSDLTSSPSHPCSRPFLFPLSHASPSPSPLGSQCQVPLYGFERTTRDGFQVFLREVPVLRQELVEPIESALVRQAHGQDDLQQTATGGQWAALSIDGRI